MQWPIDQYLVSRQHRLVYCPVPKVACSSLKHWFFEVAGLERPMFPGLHDFIRSNRERLGLAVDETALRSADYFRFIFLREPCSRLVSAFADKFIRFGTSFWAALPLTEKIQKRRGRAVNLEQGICFREFAEYVIDAPDRALDEHWCPQSVYLADVEFNFIGRYEHLAADLQRLVRLAGLTHCPQLSHLNASPYEQHRRGICAADQRAGELRRLDHLPHWLDFYDAPLLEAVRQRYAVDYGVLARAAARPATERTFV